MALKAVMGCIFAKQIELQFGKKKEWNFVQKPTLFKYFLVLFDNCSAFFFKG